MTTSSMIPTSHTPHAGTKFRSGEKVNILHVGIDRIKYSALFETVERLVEHGNATMTYVNVHVLNTAVHDQPLRAFLNGVNLCYCDGEGVRLGARLLGEELPEKMTAADFIWDFAARAEGRWRLFWIAGTPGVAAAAAARLRERYPRLQVETEHGFHTDHNALLTRVNAAHPDIVFVGMGTPIQEHWVAAHRAHIEAPLVWVIGGTADILSGELWRGPAWLCRRQEWLARLIAAPRRVWRRYLIGNALFLARVLRGRFFGTRY